MNSLTWGAENFQSVGDGINKLQILGSLEEICGKLSGVQMENLQATVYIDLIIR